MIYFEKFVIGTIIGSFIDLMVIRSLRHESIIMPASHCDYCRHPLRPWELIPIISFLFLRGKCSNCKHPISPESTIVEIITGIVALINPISIKGITEIAFQITLLILSLYDQKTMTMPTDFILVLFTINLIQIHILANLHFILLTILFYLGSTIINHYRRFIGNGDVDIIFILILKTGVNSVVFILTLASALALLQFLGKRVSRKIPFIPYLSISYLLLT